MSSSGPSVPVANMQTSVHDGLSFASAAVDDWFGESEQQQANFELVRYGFESARAQWQVEDSMTEAFGQTSLNVDTTAAKADAGELDDFETRDSMKDSEPAAHAGVKGLVDSSTKDHAAGETQNDVSGINTFAYELRESLLEIRRRSEDSGYLSDDSRATTMTPDEQEAEQKSRQRSREKSIGTSSGRSCNSKTNEKQAEIRSLDIEATLEVPSTAPHDMPNNHRERRRHWG